MESSIGICPNHHQHNSDGLEKILRDIIEKEYCCEFVKPIKVKIDGDRYTAIIYLHDDLFGGLVISNQCESEQKFLDYFTKEIKTKRLDRSCHFKLKVYANIETQEGIR